MKRSSKKLLDDLIEDSASPDYRAEVLNKTLCSARQRKRLRQLSAGLGAVMLAGLFLFVLKGMREPAISLNQVRPANSQPPQTQVVSTASDAVLTIVQTSNSVPPREIGDQELMTLLSRHGVGLVRYASGETELIH
jgi:hypothetical protein